MKRALIGTVAAIFVLGVGWTLWRPARPSAPPAARWVPADTLLLVECPDLAGSAIRGRETALARIFQEPEVAAFLAKPLARLHETGVWKRAWPSLVRLKPRAAFLAVASLTQNMPHAVAGCAFAGDRKEAEALLAEARAQAQAATPGGKLAQEPFGGFQIESFSNDGITVAACVTRDVLWVANDIDLLKSTLERASGKIPVTLSTTASYRQSMKRLPRNPDLRLFLQPNPGSDKLLAHLVEPTAQEEGRNVEAIALGVRFEGENLRERLFVLQKQTAPHPQLSQKTIGLTSPRTLFYGAMAPLFAETSSEPAGAPPAASRPMRVLLSALHAAPPATFAQFKTAFGPEHALIVEWPESVPQPNLYFALEVRDPGQARKFVESAFRAWSRSEGGGVAVWINNGNTPIHPAVALTRHHLLAGLSPESLVSFASGAAHSRDEGTLEQSAQYLKAMAAVSKPEIGVAYLDARPFFDRFYGWLRPLMIVQGSVKMGNVCDFGLLPVPSTISRHLAPISLSATQDRSGVLLESAGPVTFLEVSAGLGAVAAALLGPTVQITPGNPASRLPLRPSPLSFPDVSPAPGPSPDASEP